VSNAGTGCASRSRLQLFLLGIFKKFVIADRMAVFADPVFADPAAFSSNANWLALLAYSLRIYADFSGYSDMALGVAHLFGYRLTQNFNMPYLAVNPSDFWRRWHISLSTWLRDYIFIPLGGSRGGEWRTCRNLLIVMALGGLWHGANWTYLLWGLYHGLLLAGYRLFFHKPAAPARTMTSPLLALRACQILVTFTLVTLGWVLFRPEGDKALAMYERLFAGLAGSPADTPSSQPLVDRRNLLRRHALRHERFMVEVLESSARPGARPGAGAAAWRRGTPRAVHRETLHLLYILMRLLFPRLARIPRRLPKSQSRLRKSSSRRARQTVLSCMAFFILLNVALSVGMDTIAPFLRDGDFVSRRQRAEARAAANPGRPLTVVLGSSRADHGICPLALDDSGPLISNCSQVGAGPLFAVVDTATLAARRRRAAIDSARILATLSPWGRQKCRVHPHRPASLLRQRRAIHSRLSPGPRRNAATDAGDSSHADLESPAAIC